MITVLREQGFRVVIYKNDHSPPHVHVYYQAGKARFDLSDGQDGGVRLMSVSGYGVPDLKRARHLVSTMRVFLLEEWIKLHG